VFRGRRLKGNACKEPRAQPTCVQDALKITKRDQGLHFPESEWLEATSSLAKGYAYREMWNTICLRMGR
jgi:hypothetical protein